MRPFKIKKFVTAALVMKSLATPVVTELLLLVMYRKAINMKICEHRKTLNRNTCEQLHGLDTSFHLNLAMSFYPATFLNVIHC